MGVALSDPLHVTAQPLEVVEADEGIGERLRAIVEEYDVDRIIVGLPVSLDGTEGPAAAAARDFARRVEEETGVEVELSDERLSSVTAERALIEGGVRRRRRRQTVDKVAAAVMLQAYLDRS